MKWPRILLPAVFAFGNPGTKSYSSVSEKTRCLPILSHHTSPLPPSPALRVAFTDLPWLHAKPFFLHSFSRPKCITFLRAC